MAEEKKTFIVVVKMEMSFKEVTKGMILNRIE